MRSSPLSQKLSIPIYLQIAENLMERITNGELVQDTRLPSEREFSEQLNVSRMTIRAALRVLDNKGLLRRKPGAGTFIAKPKIERSAGKLVPFTRGMTNLGFQPKTTILNFEKRMADVFIAGKLQIPVSAPVYSIQRLRSLNQEPVMLEQFTMPAARFPNLEAHDLESRSIYEITETEYGIAPHHSQQSLEAVNASEYEAGLLGVNIGAAIMLERRLSFDKTGVPIEYGSDLYRGDRFRFITESAPLGY